MMCLAPPSLHPSLSTPSSPHLYHDLGCIHEALGRILWPDASHADRAEDLDCLHSFMEGLHAALSVLCRGGRNTELEDKGSARGRGGWLAKVSEHMGETGGSESTVWNETGV